MELLDNDIIYYYYYSLIFLIILLLRKSVSEDSQSWYFAEFAPNFIARKQFCDSLYAEQPSPQVRNVISNKDDGKSPRGCVEN